MNEQPARSALIGLSVAPASHRIRPGEQAVYLITIENRGPEAQSQSIAVEGVLPGWYRLDFDAERRSFPGERRTATLIISVPTDATVADFHLQVSVRSGSAESAVACDLSVTPLAQTASAEAPSVSLAPTSVLWRGEPQGFERLTLNIRNTSGGPAEYLLVVEGLQRGWYTLPARVRVPAGQAIDYEMRLSPPPRARQGQYPFVVNVSVDGSPEATARAQASLTIEAASQQSGGQRDVSPVTADLQPRQARTPAEPVLPPDVTLGPRSSFRFGQGEIAAHAIVTVENRSRLIERYQVTVEGIDEEWYSLGMGEIRLEPGSSAQVPLRLTPRSGPDAPAGDYEFRVRVSPHTYPDSFAEVGGVISIVGVAAFDARLTPAQTNGRKEKFKLTLLNTGSVPLSLWLEASDPEGLCKFKYPPPPNLEPGREAVVPIWVGANRNGLVGSPKRLDFRLRVSPAGGASMSARNFDARFVHQPFMGGRMLAYCALIAFCAMIVGLLFTVGTSSVSQAVTSVSCGFDDDYQDTKNGPVFVREKCGGAPLSCQKGFCAPTVQPTAPPGPPTPRPVTPGPTIPCGGNPQLAYGIGRLVTIKDDARIRNEAGTASPQIARGNNRPASIVGGPRCVDNLVWWHIDAGAVRGWTAEYDENGVQLILPR